MNSPNHKAFTLIEILVVVAIIAILAAVVLASFSRARDNAQFARARAEFKELANALELYKIDHGDYPADVDRDIPSGIEQYLSTGGVWPDAPWPGSVYDWDVWEDPDDSDKQIVQISIRFCPIGESDAENCNFPDQDWAQSFDVNSAVYYCFEGACRAHISEPIDYPGYCVNC